MNIEFIIELIVGAVNLGLLTYMLLRNNKLHIETNAVIQSSTKELQTNITDHLDELKKDQMARLDNLRQSLDESFSLLKIEISRMSDTVASEQKSTREENDANSKNVTAEILKLRDDVAKFRHFLDQAITV